MNVFPRPRPSVMHDANVQERFRSMWAAGVPANDMADALGLNDERQVRRWRIKLGLPTRGLDWLRGKPRPPRRMTT